MNWIAGLLSELEVLHGILLRIAALSGDVRSSYIFDVILSLPVPDPNSLLWISKAGMTSSCVVLLSEVVSLINFCVSSSSRSNQRQISSILCFSTFLRVNFGLIPKKKPILASF